MNLKHDGLGKKGTFFRSKVLILDTIFTPTVRDGALCGLLYEPREASSPSRGKGSTFISLLFLLRPRDTTSDGLAPRIELAISSSAFKRCINLILLRSQKKKKKKWHGTTKQIKAMYIPRFAYQSWLLF